MKRVSLRIAGAFLVVLLGMGLAARGETKTIARCGAGFLEEVDGYRVLHVKGEPYEMGYQQGALLRDDIREIVHFLFDVKAKELKLEVGGIKLLSPKQVIKGIAARQRKYVPERFFEEMHGIADGAGLDVQDIVVANFIPELFHCSGFAMSGSATKDGTLYHGRILDYGCDWRLQEHAVLTVAEPRGKIPFVNVTYAGFVGSVTGMNAERVSIGEMGGRGMGHWDGVPMALLVRMVLEEADTLDQAIAVFRDHPRTCEYYYVIADGKTGKAVGMEASWDVFGTVGHGRDPCQAARRHQGRSRAFGRRPLPGAGPSRPEGARDVRRRVGAAPDGPPRCDEVEPAQRPVRDHDDPLLGRQRFQGRQAGLRAALPRLPAQRAAEASAGSVRDGAAGPPGRTPSAARGALTGGTFEIPDSRFQKGWF